MEREAASLSDAEELVWLAFLSAEVRSDGARLLSMWVRTSDGSNARLLDETFKIVWREGNGRTS